MTENNNFEAAKKFIQAHSRFFMASHQRTDGDDCGSMLALGHVIDQMGKQTTLVAKFGVPTGLQFLPGKNKVLDDYAKKIDTEDFDAIILFGCNKPERTGLDSITVSALPILNIDHHPDNALFGQVNLVDSKKSSVAELVFDFIKYMGVEIDAHIAKNLMTGIFTDTGSFMHSNTAASTLEVAGELMKYGARVDMIHNFTYANKDLPSLKAWARAMENTRIDRNSGIAISIISQEDLDEIGEVSDDTFTGLVETLNTIPDTKFSIFLRQEGDKIKGSMRSEERKNVDVSKIARMLGGGGHKLAAGFEIPGKIIKLPNGGWKIEKI